MILNECHHMARVGVEVVKHQVVIHAVKASPLVVGLLYAGRVNGGAEGEVHHRLQVAIGLGYLAATLPCCSVGRLLKPSLAHYIKVGVIAIDYLHPPGHRLSVGVWVGVHPDAVNAHRLNPPNAVLNQVVHHMCVVLIQVGHGRYEPALNGLFQVNLAGVGVKHGCQFVTRLLEVGVAWVA